MRRLFPPFLSGRAAVGLLLVRVLVGSAFVLHGWGKLHSPGGPTGRPSADRSGAGPSGEIAAKEIHRARPPN